MTRCTGLARRVAGVVLALGLAAIPAARAAEPLPTKPELVPELSAYYTNLGLYFPLTGKPIPDSKGDDEFEIYRELLLDSLTPRVLLLEASVYPMPILGTWVRRNEPAAYDDADVGDFNWIESVTAGFQEPAALSLFLGSAMNLVRPGERRRGTNKAHVGYLLSVGDRHIRDNRLVDDPWYELEWKLKGEREFEGERLSWSFRLGTYQHGHPDIADTVYVALRRGNLAWNAPFLGWLTNSAGRFSVAMTTDGFSIARSELLLEKRYPLPRLRVALALEAGFIYESNRAYTGSLVDDDNNLILALRPNIEF